MSKNIPKYIYQLIATSSTCCTLIFQELQYPYTCVGVHVTWSIFCFVSEYPGAPFLAMYNTHIQWISLKCSYRTKKILSILPLVFSPPHLSLNLATRPPILSTPSTCSSTLLPPHFTVFPLSTSLWKVPSLRPYSSMKVLDLISRT